MNRRVAHVASIVALALVLAIVPAALAAKGGGGGKPGSGSFSLVLMDGATEAAHYGRVTFEVSTTATDLPMVGVRCYQGENWVMDGYVGYFPGYLFNPWFVLDSGYWADGVATTCNARLFYFDRRGRERVLATMSFPVAP